MSTKPKFRSRKLDYKRNLPIHREGELPDLDDETHRAFPVMATGVEKEEEEEHHLQAVISASTLKNSKAAENVYIPTPNASIVIDFYDEHYKPVWKMPSSLIRFSNIVEECIGVTYCVDDEDLSWLEELNKRLDAEITVDQFELVVNELENITNDKQKFTKDEYATLNELESFLVLEPDALKSAGSSIYEFWKKKRENDEGKPLLKELRVEESHKGDFDPYVCFRKREIKTSRKTRRTDAQCMQRLRQLRIEMDVACQLVDMIVKREKMRQEYLLLEHAVFEQKILLRQSKKQVGIPEQVFEEARTARKKAAKSSKAAATAKTKQAPKRRKQSVTEDDHHFPKDVFAAIIEAEINSRRAANSQWEDVTETCLTLIRHPASQFFMPDVLIERTDICLPRARRRIGRGGRLIYDRDFSVRTGDRWKYDQMACLSDEENFNSYSEDLAMASRYRIPYIQEYQYDEIKVVTQDSASIPALKAPDPAKLVATKKIKLKLAQ